MKAILAAFLAAFICSPAFAGDGTVHKGRNPIPNRYLVQFEDFVESPEEEAKVVAEQYGVKLRRVFKHSIKGFSMAASPEQAVAISEDSRIKHVEEDSRGGEVLHHPLPPPEGPGWARDRINQFYPTLDHSAYTTCDTGGTGVVVYVLDTGINPHPIEFGDRLVNGYTVDGDNYSDDYNWPYGHGTAVASIIGSATYGVARNVKLVNVKVLRKSTNYNSGEDKVLGVEYVSRVHDLEPTKVPKVMNMSFAHEISTGSMLENAVINAIRKGIVVVVSAGNGINNIGVDACTYGTPARLGRPNYPPHNSHSVSTITVGATQLPNPYTRDERRPSSNQGPCVDIFAPGNMVDALRADGMHYKTFGGTSAAAPYVSGAVARHLSNYVGSLLLGTEGLSETVENSLKSYATPGLIYDATPNLLLGLFQCRRRPSG